MTVAVDCLGRYYVTHMKPGERVAATVNSDRYVFEKTAEDMPRLRLVIEDSTLPDDFAEYIRSNRNVQEVMCDTDIDMGDMEVFLSSSWHLGIEEPITFFAKAPCASCGQGTAYHTDKVTKLELFM